MNGKIAVLGAGALGSSVGADLTDAGLDVVLVDQWPEHVNAMKTDGLTIRFPGETLRVPVCAWHVCELAERAPAFDLVFLAVKSGDTRWTAELIEPYLKETGVLVGLQNGMNNADLAAVVGPERTIGAVVEIFAEIFTPGLVRRDTVRTGTWFGLGELDGAITPRLEAVKAVMENAGVVGLTENIEGAKWTKLVANTMVMGPVAVTGLKMWDAARLPGMTDFAVAAGRESAAVGKALGYTLEPIFGMSADDFSGADDDVLIRAMNTMMEHIGKEATTAATHDYIKGRKSELSFINGLTARKGKALGIETPCNDAVAETDRRINAGEIETDPANFGLMKAMADSIPNR